MVYYPNPLYAVSFRGIATFIPGYCKYLGLDLVREHCWTTWTCSGGPSPGHGWMPPSSTQDVPQSIPPYTYSQDLIWNSGQQLCRSEVQTCWSEFSCEETQRIMNVGFFFLSEGYGGRNWIQVQAGFLPSSRYFLLLLSSFEQKNIKSFSCFKSLWLLLSLPTRENSVFKGIMSFD